MHCIIYAHSVSFDMISVVSVSMLDCMIRYTQKRKMVLPECRDEHRELEFWNLAVWGIMKEKRQSLCNACENPSEEILLNWMCVIIARGGLLSTFGACYISESRSRNDKKGEGELCTFEEHMTTWNILNQVGALESLSLPFIGKGFPTVKSCGDEIPRTG